MKKSYVFHRGSIIPCKGDSYIFLFHVLSIISLTILIAWFNTNSVTSSCLLLLCCKLLHLIRCISVYETLFAIWFHLYNLKNVRKTLGGMLHLVKLQTFFTFYKLYKWYQITQNIIYCVSPEIHSLLIAFF